MVQVADDPKQLWRPMWLVLAIVAMLNSSSRAQTTQATLSCTNTTFVTKLTGTRGDPGRFGFSLAIADPYLVVGASLRRNNVSIDTGAAFVYHFNSGAAALTPATILTPPNGMAKMQFGYATAVSGNYLLVGAQEAAFNGSASGAAYLYTLRPVDAQATHMVQVLPDDVKANKRFGQDVAINGAIMAIGAPFDDHSGYAAGSVYLFSIQEGAQGPTVVQRAKLTANDSNANDFYGIAVAMTDRCLVVGSPYDDDKGSSSGSAYVYLLSADGTTPEQTMKLVPKDGLQNDFFGSSLGLSDTTLVVGADGVNEWRGAAYVFVLEDNFSRARQVMKLVPSDVSFQDHFGYAVAISGDHVIVGSYLADVGSVSDAGAAYYYRLDAARSNVTFVTKLTANDSITNANLAYAVAVSDSHIVLGAPFEKFLQVGNVGSTYIFATGCPASAPTSTATTPVFKPTTTSTVTMPLTLLPPPTTTTSASTTTMTPSTTTTTPNTATMESSTTTMESSTTTMEPSTATTLSTTTTLMTTASTTTTPSTTTALSTASTLSTTMTLMTTTTTTTSTTSATTTTLTTTASNPMTPSTNTTSLASSSSTRPALSSSSSTVTTTSLTTASTTLVNTASSSLETTVATTNVVTSALSMTTADDSTPAVRGSRLRASQRSALIPALVGSLVAICVLVALALLALRRRKTQNRTKAWEGSRLPASSIAPAPPLNLTGTFLDMVENPVYQPGGQAPAPREEESPYYATAAGEQRYAYARIDGQQRLYGDKQSRSKSHEDYTTLDGSQHVYSTTFA